MPQSLQTQPQLQPVRQRTHRPDVPRVQPLARPHVRGWLSRFAGAFLITVIGSYVLMEALELRFCQPFRCEHMHKVRFFQKEVQAVDVVYLGTSQVHYGVMPAVVAQEADRIGTPIGNGYNLAVPAAELELSWILARDLLKENHCPRTLIVGIWPGILAADDPGQPDYVCRYGNLSDIARRVDEGNVSPLQLLSAPFRGLENLLQWPVYSLKKPLPQFRWEYLRQSQGGWWLPEDVASAPVVPRENWQVMLSKVVNGKNLHFCDDSRPARLLKSFHDLASQRGMQLAVVYLPQHPDFLQHGYTPGSTDRFHDWMNSFCRNQGIRYRDLNERDHYEHGDFADPVHLNARGALKFSKQLAHVVGALNSVSMENHD